MDTIIYFGPTIKSLGLAHKQVFSGDLPPAVQNYIKREPGFNSLFTTLDRLAIVSHDLKKPRSPSAQIYNHFVNKLSK